MKELLIGAIAVSAGVAALFFLRFYRQTGDRFFALFACAFVLEGLSRLPQVFFARALDDEPAVYLVRLVEYLLILYAIWHKNRARR